MNKFKQNELVWAKFDDYPWWPGVIKREVPPSQFEILFCGDDAKALIPKKYIAKWENNFDQLTSKIEDKDLLFSVGIALKLQEGIFDFKDHVEFITNSNKEEIVKEIVDCVCDITGYDCYLTIDEPDTPVTITCIDSGVDSLAHNEHTIDLFESSISDSFDTTFGKLDFQNKVKDDNDKQDIIDAATKIVKDTNEEAKEYSDQELSDEAEKSFEDNKQKSAIENGTTTETKEAQEKIEQYEMQD